GGERGDSLDWSRSSCCCSSGCWSSRCWISAHDFLVLCQGWDVCIWQRAGDCAVSLRRRGAGTSLAQRSSVRRRGGGGHDHAGTGRDYGGVHWICCGWGDGGERGGAGSFSSGVCGGGPASAVV